MLRHLVVMSPSRLFHLSERPYESNETGKRQGEFLPHALGVNSLEARSDRRVLVVEKLETVDHCIEKEKDSRPFLHREEPERRNLGEDQLRS